MSLFTSTEALGVTTEEINCPKLVLLEYLSLEQNLLDKCLLIQNQQLLHDLVRISGLSHGTDVWLNNAQDFS